MVKNKIYLVLILLFCSILWCFCENNEKTRTFIRFDEVIPTTTVTLEGNIIKVPEKECEPGYRKDRRKRCRKIY